MKHARQPLSVQQRPDSREQDLNRGLLYLANLAYTHQRMLLALVRTHPDRQALADGYHRQLCSEYAQSETALARHLKHLPRNTPTTIRKQTTRQLADIRKALRTLQRQPPARTLSELLKATESQHQAMLLDRLSAFALSPLPYAG